MIEIVKEYASKRLELIKMELTEKASVGTGTLVFLLLSAIAFLFFIILLNIAIGLLIGHALNNYGYGMLIMAGFYLLMLILIFLLRRFITGSIANKIIKLLNP